MDNTFISEEKPDHHFRTEIPNIVFKLGLSPEAVALYAYLKQTCGDDGSCWKKKETLLNETNFGNNAYIKYRKELSQNFTLLGGKPLIYVEERKKEDGGNDTTKIHIANIWRENGNFFRNQKIIRESQNESTPDAKRVDPRRETRHKEELSEEDLLKNNKQADGFFEGLELTEDDKKFLKKYDIVLLAEAISVCQTIEIKTTFAQALKWLIQKPKSEWPKPKPTTNDQITWAQQAIKEVESIIPKQFKVEFLTYGVEIVAAAWCLVIEYKDLRFKEKLTEWIQKVKNQ